MKKLFLILVLLFSIPSIPTHAETLFGVESTPQVAIPAKISLALMATGATSFISALALSASMPIADIWIPVVSGALVIGAVTTVTGIAIGASAALVAEFQN